MKYFYLIWKSIWRKKVRTILTVLSIFVAFLLFGLLSALNQAFTGNPDLANASRLVVVDKISIINSMPGSYLAKIEAIPGVEKVALVNWFGGYYQEQRNQFPQFPVDPERYLEVFPELVLPDEQKQKWFSTRDSAVVSIELANAYGFKVGDRVPIHSSIWTNKSGSQVWEFEIAGIFENADPRQGAPLMLFDYQYFDEGRSFGTGTMGWFVVKVADSAKANEVADAIDANFANSPNETKTDTEAAFAASFVKQFGNIALIVSLILGAVFFTILLVSGNTMAQSVRERISELAVLKTLGFEDKSVMTIVLAESVLIMLVGGVLGLAASWALVTYGMQGAGLPGLYLPNGALLTGLLYIVLAGIVSGVFPALRAMRLTITDALSRA